MELSRNTRSKKEQPLKTGLNITDTDLIPFFLTVLGVAWIGLFLVFFVKVQGGVY